MKKLPREMLSKQDRRGNQTLFLSDKERWRRVIVFVAVGAYVCLLFVNVLLPTLPY